MFKKKIMLLLIISLLFLTGCEETKKEELQTDISSTIKLEDSGAKLVCHTDYDYTELNYVIGSKYVVYADDKNKVTKVISQEIIESSDKEILDNFENYLNENHSAAEQYKGYTYDIKRENNRVISDTAIDYSEFDLKEFAKNNNETLNEDDTELTIDSIKKKYVSLGATCEEK